MDIPINSRSPSEQSLYLETALQNSTKTATVAMAAGSLEDTRTTLNDKSPQIHRSGPMAGRRGFLFQKPRGNNFRTDMQLEQGGKLFLRNGTFRKHRQVNYLKSFKVLVSLPKQALRSPAESSLSFS